MLAAIPPPSAWKSAQHRTSVLRVEGTAAPAVDLTQPARSRAWRETLVPLGGFALLAVVLLGRGVIVHPEGRVVGDRFADKTIFMWAFLWWPHALIHGHDPFVVRHVWAPHGVDLAWVTAVPGASLLLAPLSETLGPVFAYNAAALAAPALAAWTTFLLARRLTRSVPASLVAGLLFGFSPYLMAQASSHLNLTLVFLVPLLGWLAVAFVQGDVGRGLYIAAAAAILVAQLSFSAEIAATLTVTAVIVLLLAFLLLPELRGRLRKLTAYTGLAYAVAGILALPYLLHAFAGDEAPPARGVIPASADLANVVVPTKATLLRPPGSGTIVHHFASNGAEQGAYLGVPLLLILVLTPLVLRGRARRGAWLLLLGAVASTLLALGPRMRVDGHQIAVGAWTWIERLPAFHDALPIRLDMYTALFGALAAALCLSQTGVPRIWRYGLSLLAVILLVPNPSDSRWTSTVPQSSFFRTAAYRPYLRPGKTALVLPYGPTGWSMLWQAETHFRFSMIGGWVGRSITRPECPWYWSYRALLGVPPPDGGAAFRRFLLQHHVSVVVEGPGTQAWARRLLSASLADVRAEHAADATVLRIPRNLPAALPSNAPTLRPALRPQAPPAQLPCTVPPYSSS
jgi:hypothetical protein